MPTNNEQKTNVADLLALVKEQADTIEAKSLVTKDVKRLAVCVSTLTSVFSDQEKRLQNVEKALTDLVGRR